MRLVLGVLAFLVLSACIDAGTDLDSSGPTVRRVAGARVGGWDPVVDGPVPPGCDANRTAVLHTYDGQIVGEPMPLGMGCIVTTTWGAGEPSIGFTSKGNLFLYPSYQAPLPQASGAEQFTGLGMARSTDQGATWVRQFSTIGPVNYHPYTADPFMFTDPFTDRVFMEDLMIPPFNCSNLSFSDDEGESWTQTLGGCLVWDHVSYGSGKPVTSTPSGGYPSIIYRCAITYVATTLVSEATGCQKSLTGGMTWEPPGQPAYLFDQDGQPYAPSTCNGAAHHVFVDHRGWVWLPRGWCDQKPWVSISKDEGATWTQYQVAAPDGGIAGHDTGVAVDANGVAYYFFISSSQRPMLSLSFDDGATWSEPRDVAPPGIARASSPNLQAGAGGKIAITYGANLDDESATGVHMVVTTGYFADTERPLFQTVLANPRDRPIANGNCGGTCSGQADFITMKIAPNGQPWTSVMDRNLLAAATIYGAPSLWDDSDPNGPYKNE
jgi:hypothetical protein